MERNALGYILVFVCIVLAIWVSISAVDIHVLTLQLSLRDPQLSKDDKLFNARFLYSVDVANLDGDLELKDDVRERLIDLELEAHEGEEDIPTRDELMAKLKERERRNTDGLSEGSDIILMLFIVLALGVAGLHFLARFMTTPSWREIKTAESPFSIAVAATALVAFFVATSLGGFREKYGVIAYLLPVFGYVVIIVLISRSLWAQGHDIWRKMGFVDVDYGHAVFVGVVGYLAYFPLQFIINSQGPLLTYFVGRIPESHPFFEEFLETAATGDRLIIVFLAVVSAPFFEEIIFRGIFLGSLTRILPPAFGFVICGLVFGLVHGSFLNVFAIFFLGVHLSFLMYKTGSIITPIVVHFLFNAHAMIQTLLMR